MTIVLGVTLLAASYAHGRIPPRGSQDACKRKPEGSSCSFMSPKGKRLEPALILPITSTILVDRKEEKKEIQQQVAKENLKKI